MLDTEAKAKECRNQRRVPPYYEGATGESCDRPTEKLEKMKVLTKEGVQEFVENISDNDITEDS
ncbi:28823_t:CDS:2 [Gigaspora margarita]|uniref:28823_t:CDS:1 n=1 Tax=Gigaspora margarita TaxID=4874 RepID=A0ABN7W6Q7_GIGMA|nr:28823_t:CDS:2 [Gigaspora margarita]